MAFPSLAVLPIRCIGTNKDGEYLCDGLTEELIYIFSNMEGIEVASRSSCFYFKDKFAEIKEVGKKLGVSYVLNGSARLSGGVIRLIVELTNSITGYVNWTHRIEKPLDDFIKLQEEIAHLVYNHFLSKSSHFPEDAIRFVPQNDPIAYDFYLKGRYHFYRYSMDHFQKAIFYYEKAIARQPEFAIAYAGAAFCYMGLGGYIDVTNYKTGKEFALKAIALNDRVIEAHLVLGYIRLFYERDWENARTSFEHAIELNERSADAHRAYGIYHLTVGNLETALYEHELAVRYDPLNTIFIRGAGWVASFMGLYDKANREYDKTLEIDETFRPSIESKGVCLTYQGLYEEAMSYFEQYQQMTEDPLKGWTGLGYCYGKLGDFEKAQLVLEKLELRKQKNPKEPLSLDFAIVNLGMGKIDRAIYFIEKSIQEKFILTTCMVLNDPIFNELRSVPRFIQLIDYLNFPAKESERSYGKNQERSVLVKTPHNEQLVLFWNDLIYIKAEGNYARFNWREGHSIKQRMIRITLGEVQKQINSAQLIQCHRSYLVNIDNIDSLQGGLKNMSAILKWSNELIPVSRSKSKEIRTLFEERGD